MLSLTSLFPPAPVFIWPLASTAKSLSSQGHVGKAILCVGMKWCYISPISPHLTIQTWLHAKFSTFILRIVDETWCRNINLWIHVKNEKSLVFFSPLLWAERNIWIWCVKYYNEIYNYQTKQSDLARLIPYLWLKLHWDKGRDRLFKIKNQSPVCLETTISLAQKVKWLAFD